jgi:hypothetical protein
VGVKLNGTHQLLAYASKEVGLEINTEKLVHSSNILE